jgi:ribonuclease BN (tRNA processing enzyme)
MRIQFLGVGSRFNNELGNPSLIIWGDGHGFLINCGYTVFPILKKANLLGRIDKVFISNRESENSGSLDSFLTYRKDIIQNKTRFFGIIDHLDYLMEINENYGKNRKDFFIFDPETKIQTIPVNYKKGVQTQAFYNYGILYSGNTSQTLLESPQARDAKVIIHHVSFDDLSDSEVPFSVLARAPEVVRKKTYLIGYSKSDLESNFSKVMQFGFAGFATVDKSISL